LLQAKSEIASREGEAAPGLESSVYSTSRGKENVNNQMLGIVLSNSKLLEILTAL
jgi:hypothetical protein